MQSVSNWLKSLSLEHYSQVFADNDVDLDALRLLSDKELQELGVSLGHRKKLMKAVADLADSPTETEDAPATEGETAKREKGEKDKTAKVASPQPLTPRAKRAPASPAS